VNARAFYLLGFTCLTLALVAPALSLNATAPEGSPLVTWANDATDSFYTTQVKARETSVDDEFVPNPVAGGQMTATPCAGSIWVYDYAHGIAAGNDRTDATGAMVMYFPKPPTLLPNRDLLALRSKQGLHLGMTLAQASAILRVPGSDATLLPGGRAELYVEKMVPCLARHCAHRVTIIFKDGHAVALSILHALN